MPNPSNASPLATGSSESFPQGEAFCRLRHFKLVFFTIVGFAGLLISSTCVLGQDPAPAPTVPPAPMVAFSMADLRPTLANVQNAITAAGVSRWKIPGDVRANTEQDVTSMQRDLSATLPGLMSTAESAPATNGLPPLAPSFAVFRNLDALYDVLLRVSQIANVGASASDANSLESARAALEGGRGKLGAWLLQAIAAQDAQLAQSAAAAARPAAPPPAPTRVVIDDGPENPKPRKKKAVAPPAPQ